MKKEMKKVPAIRFKGFTDDWEQRKFSEIAQRESNMQLSSSDFPSVEYEDVVAEEGILNKNINSKGTQKKGIIFDGNQILYGKLRPYLHNWLNPDFKGIAVGDWWVLKPIETDKNFLYRLIQTPKFDDVANQSSGSKMPRADWNLVANTTFMIPSSIAEQKEIGTYFNNIDNLITLHQRKSDQLKKLKAYFLQNLFPAKGEKVPKIRFKGFTGDWEQYKLSNIYGTIRNAFVGTASPYYVDKGHFYLESNNVKDGHINKNTQVYINDEFYFSQKDKWLHTGDIVMVQSGHVGHAAVIPESLDNIAAHALIMFQNQKIETNPYFLNTEYQTDASKKQIESITKGNTIKHILASDMKNFMVMVPSLPEQQAIATYFKNLDNLIAHNQRKLDALQTLKKYLLQNLFI